MGARHSPKPKHHCNLVIRLFSVISRTLTGWGVLPHCRCAIGVFYSLSRLGNLLVLSNKMIRIFYWWSSQVLDPHKLCKQWVEILRIWTKGTLDKLPFGIPMFWREPRDHCADCYFGSKKTWGYNKNNKCKIDYPSLPSVLRQVSHSAEIPVISFRSTTLFCWSGFWWRTQWKPWCRFWNWRCLSS